MPRTRFQAGTFFLVWLLCSLAPTSSVRAQDFRVYTAVTEVGPDASSRRVVSRSLTLFHSGRVYDHMEQMGELVIFEPIHDHFILIRDNTAAVVTFEELKQYLDVASKTAGGYAERLAVSSDPAEAKLGAQLKFQLDPQFEIRFDPKERRVRLEGSALRYEVRGDAAPSPLVLGQYLTYADWTARLNAVLHSQATFPGPRESLNQTLREHELLPVSVTLQARQPEMLYLQANHEFRWQLQAIDKDQIHQWERLRQSDRMQWVSFREYQQRLVASSGRRHR